MASGLKRFFLGAPDPVQWSHLTRRQWLFAVLAFVSVFTMYMLNPWTHLHPQVWGDMASALELKDGITVEHGLWRFFVGWLVRISPNGLTYVLHMLGAVSGSVCAVVMYLLLCMLFPLTIKVFSVEIVRVRLLIDTLSLGLVWLLALSEGYWNIFRFFTVQTSLVLMVMLVVLMQILFLATRRIRFLFACYFLTGLLAGGSMLGVFLLVAVLLVFAVVKRRSRRMDFGYTTGPGYVREEKDGTKVKIVTGMPLMNPLVAERLKTPSTLLFLCGFAVSAFADISFALRLPGATLGKVLLDSAMVYWKDLLSYADTLDLVKVSLLVLAPLVVNLWFCRQATDTEKFLPRHLSIMYLVTALLAYSQLSGCSGLWFWTWGGSSLMPLSPLFLAMASFLAILVVATSLVVFVVDACCRDVRALVANTCSDADGFLREAEDVLGQTIASGGRRVIFVKGLMFSTVVFGLCCLSVPARRQMPQRTVMDAIFDFNREMAREAMDCTKVVTNGALDDVLRLGLYRQNAPTKVVSVKSLRRQGDAREGNVGWMTDLPWCHFAGGWDFSGLVARQNISEQEAAISRKNVRALAERFVALDKNGTLARTPDRFLRNVSDVAKWHLARVLNLQLQVSDGKSAELDSKRLESLVRDLDRGNSSLQAALVRMESAGTQTSLVLTPQEGLKVAVDRSDFELARRYVDALLTAEPNNALALYARGMIFLKDGQNVRAAETLKLVAAKWPNEPAVLNNLAVALFRANNPEDAKAWMRKMMALPQTDDVMRANAAKLLK